MTKAEFIHDVRSCPCGKLPYVDLVKKLVDCEDYLQRMDMDIYYRVKCECGLESDLKRTSNDALLDWNEMIDLIMEDVV